MKIAGYVTTALLSVLAIASCASDQSTSETFVTTVTTVKLGTTGTTGTTVTTTTVVNDQVSSSTTIATVASTTSATNTNATSAPSSSIVKVAPATTVATVSRPKLFVSQTNNLNPNGTSVTVRGTGYDVNKGVYVIVCSQAAPGPQATCVGGVNIDGSSSGSVWVSSNPPNYAVGLTTPFSPDGSFTVELVVVAKSGALDCTVLKCGVVTRSDHLRYTDRTQDVFVPISFSN